MVTGQMAPVEFHVLIEVRGEVNFTVPSIRNNTTEEVFNLPEPEVNDDSFDMYFICFPILLLVLLTRTRLGRRMRAVADNPELAASCGINVERVQMMSAFLSTRPLAV